MLSTANFYHQFCPTRLWPNCICYDTHNRNGFYCFSSEHNPTVDYCWKVIVLSCAMIHPLTFRHLIQQKCSNTESSRLSSTSLTSNFFILQWNLRSTLWLHSCCISSFLVAFFPFSSGVASLRTACLFSASVPQIISYNSYLYQMFSYVDIICEINLTLSILGDENAMWGSWKCSSKDERWYVRRWVGMPKELKV